MEKIIIEMLEAKGGDCFIIKLGEKQILIDTGYESTLNSIKSTLSKEIPLSLLVITHIDEDHIRGGIKLLKENIDSKTNKIIEIEDIWFNSVKHLKIDLNETSENDISAVKEIISEELLEKSENDLSDTDISAEHGSTFASWLINKGYKWNNFFSGKAVAVTTDKTEINIDSDIKIILLSPNENNLKDLGEEWVDEMRGKGYLNHIGEDSTFDEALEAIMRTEEIMIKDFEIETSSEDTNIEDYFNVNESEDYKNFSEDYSVTNGSSIAFIIEYKGAKLLFLGDSHPSIIEQNLIKAYPEIEKTPMYFSAIKVSHHGSKYNTNNSLLKLVDSPNYLISTNGKKFKHPDLEALVRIVKRPIKNFKEDINFIQRNLIFNYQTSKVLAMDNNKCKNEYKYNVLVINRIEIEI